MATLSKANIPFQAQVLAWVLQETSALAQLRNSVDIAFWQNPVHHNIARAVYEYYDSYEGVPSENSLRALVDDMLSANDADMATFLEYSETIEVLYHGLLKDESEKEFLKSNLESLIRKRLTDMALVNGVTMAGEGNFDGLSDLVADAANFRLNKDDRHVKWSAFDRQQYLDSVKTAPVSTGFSSIDDELHGGLHPGELGIICGVAGTGKCFAEGTKILMHDGSVVAVEDIRHGDTVMGPDSSPRTVLSTTVGRGAMYKIVPSKGEPFVCNGDHILPVTQRMSSGEVRHVNISVDDYMALGNGVKKQMKLWRTGVSFPAQDVPFDPYVIGAWLGDGEKTNSAMSLGPSKDSIVAYLRAWARENGYLIRVEDARGACRRVFLATASRADGVKSSAHVKKGFQEGGSNPLLWYLKSRCVVDGEKRVPVEYLRNTEHVRLLVLAGLLDTDGSSDKGHYEITSKYKGLADDICYLARSLGLAAYCRPCVKGIKSIGFEGVYYRVSISGDTSRVPCLRHKPYTRKHNKSVLVTGFTVEEVGVDTYYGFQLDGDHLFLLGDFTVSHNSQLMVNLSANAMHQGKKVLLVTLEMSEKEINKRLDACISEEEYWALSSNVTANAVAQAKLQAWRDEHGGDCDIRYYPSQTLTVPQLKLMLKKWYSNEPMPDVIVVDYADQFLPTTDYKNSYDNQGMVYTQLVALAGHLNIPIWTASQSNREGKKAKTIQLEHLADSWKKACVAHVVYTINQDENEVKNQMLRLYSVKVRNGDKNRFHYFKTEFHKSRLVQVSETTYEGYKQDPNYGGGQQMDMNKNVGNKGWSSNKMMNYLKLA